MLKTNADGRPSSAQPEVSIAIENPPENFRGIFLSEILAVDLGNNAGTNGTAAFTDSETQAFLDGDGGDQLNIHLDVIARHAHLDALGQGDDAGHVGGTEIELRTVVVEEGGMTAAFVLGQDVNLAMELGVGIEWSRA